jgi:hypothetical protein
MKLETGIRYGALIASAGLTWSALELLTARNLLLSRFFDWRVIRYSYPPRLRRMLAPLGRPGFSLVLVLYPVAGVAFPFALLQSRLLAAGFAALVLVGHFSAQLRFGIARDGADQMQTILWVGFLVYALDLGRTSNVAAAVFVVSQLILAYVIAGTSKIASARWRDGSALAVYMGGRAFSTPAISRLFQRRHVSAVVGVRVMAWETLGALVLLGGRTGVITFLAMGAAFHVGIAFTLGLVTFMFAFLAAYPVVYALLG